MSPVLRWAVAGAVVGALFAAVTEGFDMLPTGAVLGAAAGAALRKWVARVFWT